MKHNAADALFTKPSNRFAKRGSSGTPMKEELHQSAETYRILTEQSPLGISIINKDGTYEYVNPKFIEMFGYELKDIPTGRQWFAKAYPDPQYRDHVILNWIRDLKDSKVGEIRPRSYTVTCKDGSDKTIRFRPVTLRSGHQFVVYEDITVQKQAQALLSQSEETLRALLNAITESTFLMDIDGTVLVANRTLAERLGTTVDDLIGARIYDFLPPDLATKRKAHANKAIRSGKAVRFEDERHGRIMANTVYPVFDQHGKVCQLAIYGQDVTEERKAREELIQREATLENRTNELEEVNTALRVLLKKREQDKAELEERVLFNVKELIVPYAEKLKNSRLNAKEKAYVRLLETSLNGIISPFSRKLSLKSRALTPMEIQIAHLIRNGRTTKGIADLLNVSARTVEFHRKNIRKKLGLKNRRVNLRSHLMSI